MSDIKLYVHKKGTIGISTKALQLLDVITGNDSYIGILKDKVDNSIYLYGSTATSSRFKRKLVFEPTNRAWYITLKMEYIEPLFENIVGDYAKLALEEEPYIVEGVECYKVIERNISEN